MDLNSKTSELKNLDTRIKYNFNNLNKLAKKHTEEFNDLKDSYASSVSSTLTAFDSTLKEKLKPLSESIQANTNRIANEHTESYLELSKIKEDFSIWKQSIPPGGSFL
jgi:gas vesicle protein